MEKKAELMNKRPLSDTSSEAFYDFAHEAGSGEKEREKMEGARLEGTVYEEVKAESGAQPSNSDWTKESTYDVPRPLPQKTSAVDQPLPALPTTFVSSSDVVSESSPQIYEDILDMKSPPPVMMSSREEEQLYEPVRVLDTIDGSDEGKSGEEGEGEGEIEGTTMDLVSRSPENVTPPLPAQNLPPSPAHSPPPVHLSPPLHGACDVAPPTQKPVPRL